MTPEIEKRIKAVQAGRVPAGYKRTKVGIVPKEWDVQSFGEISFKTGRKKKKEEDYPVYSINNQKGFCSQAEQFENDGYANTSKDSYTLVEKDTFAYNPARINIGSIGLLKEPDKVIISSLYVCFGLNKNCNLSFFESYFKSHRFNYDVSNYTEGSVRQYLFYDNFSKINVAIPPLSEQKKIAEILATQDRVIELKEKLIAEKQSQKKYLMSVLLGDDFKKPFKLNGVTIDKKKWEKVRCEKILFPSGKRNKENLNLEPYAITNEYGFVPQKQAHDDFGYMKNVDRSAYIIVSSNSFGYNPARINVGSIGYYDGSEDIIVSSLYEVFKTTDAIDDRFLWHWFKSDVFPKWIDKLQEGSVRQYFYYDKLIRCEINLPPLPEQKAIADVLSAADEEISLLQKGLEQEKLKKKSLMQLLLTGLVRVKV